MAVVKNTFSGILDNITTETYTITGLTSETSTTSIPNTRLEISLHFLKNLYQTLLDAGYSDTVIDESDYSISVLGFKFFVLCTAYNSAFTYGSIPTVYCYGSQLSTYISHARYDTSSNKQAYYSISDVSTCTNLEYTITVRGDKNCVCISYGSYNFPNATNPLLFIAKAKNLITSEDMFFFASHLITSNVSVSPPCHYSYKYYRKKSDLYSTIYETDSSATVSYKSNFMTAYNYIGQQTPSKTVVEPMLGNNGSLLIPSMIMCNTTHFSQGNYYKIGSDLYYCYGAKIGNSNTYEGQYALFKVSD